VLTTLLRDVLTIEHLEQLIRETNAALGGKHQNLIEREQQLLQQLSQVETRISRLLDALEHGESLSVRQRLQEREQERDQLLSALTSVREEMKQSRIEISPAALHQLVANMHHILKEGNVNTVRNLLRTFIVRIEVSRHRGIIYYTFPFALAPTEI
jgi:chromatin segregation and condensation protein Rec8/ScpA/Scc1 (kleisin family)